MESKEKENSSEAVGKKCGHVEKNEAGGDRKHSKGDTKNNKNSTVVVDTQPY